MSNDVTTRDVVLLHGLGRSPASMLPLAWRLRRAGFRCLRPGYPSTRLPVAEAVDHVRAQIARLGGAFHIAGHSLGGLIGAMLLREGTLPIARVVQLGAPNLGAPAADRLAGAWALRQICGPALGDLGRHDRTPDPHPCIGAIAGVLGPPLPGIDIADPHDGAVEQTSAWAGAGHHASVPALHTMLPLSAQAARLTAHFLKHGRFPEAPA